jgi:septum formation topological specificity factor MinE
MKKAEMEKIKKEILKIITPCMESFKDALEVEDLKSNGYMTIDQFL